MNAQPKGRVAPHPYQNTPAVNVTARAIDQVIANWHVAGWQLLVKGKAE